MTFAKRFAFHTVLSIVFGLIFFLPDFIFHLFYENYFIFNIKIYKEFLAFIAINFIILSIYSFRVKFLFYALFATFSFAELIHYSFFHSLIMPYEIPLLFSQSEEILDSLNGVIRYIVVPISLYLLQLFILFFLSRQTHNLVVKYKRYPIAVIVLVLMAGSIVASFRKEGDVFLPKAESSSIKNLYNAISWANGKIIPSYLFDKTKDIRFEPYRVEKIDEQKYRNIIVVMGESLGAKYMSLYGFGKKTTPKLDSLKDRIEYSWGYSCAVTTDVAVPTFFLLKREPKNSIVFLKGETNLFSLAKKAGYKTHYITTQKLTILGGFMANSVDIVKSRKDFDPPIYDEYLLKYLDRVDFSKKNFIVLHQRNSHSPYDQNTPKEFYKFKFKGLDFKEYMRGSYFNSLLYTDHILYKVIKKASSINSPTIVFITSDHSEMMGYEDEKGRFGHTYLGFEDAKVPFIVYKNRLVKDMNLSLKNTISHYQFSKMIAKSIGYKIINPNENGEFYINGIDIDGLNGYISYKELGKL